MLIVIEHFSWLKSAHSIVEIISDHQQSYGYADDPRKRLRPSLLVTADFFKVFISFTPGAEEESLPLVQAVFSELCFVFIHMDITLWIGYTDSFGIELLLDFFRSFKIEAPVIIR